MKKIILVLALFLFWVQMAEGQTRSLSMATGPTGGTYARIGEDIKGLMEKEGMGIRLVTSNGSFENIELLAKGEAELAMVQLDALRYFVDVAKAEGGANVFERLKVILNLYPEEIHVLTNKPEITSFYHLEGRKISVGPPKSGTALTGEVLLKLYDVKAEKSSDTPEEAANKLRSGQIDAMIFVGGAPVPFIEGMLDKFRFVRLPRNPILDQIYLRQTLGPKVYKQTCEDTETYSVPSSIVGLDINDPAYVQLMQKMVITVLTNKDYLDAKGHPKWKNSLVRYYFPNVGYAPTNAIIQIFNQLDTTGYRIVKK